MKTEPACANKKCAFNDIQVNSDRQFFDLVNEDGEIERHNRYTYRSANGSNIKLCDVCHEAVQAVTGKT